MVIEKFVRSRDEARQLQHEGWTLEWFASFVGSLQPGTFKFSKIV